jgi:hypothetical protein
MLADESIKNGSPFQFRSVAHLQPLDESTFLHFDVTKDLRYIIAACNSARICIFEVGTYWDEWRKADSSDDVSIRPTASVAISDGVRWI